MRHFAGWLLIAQVACLGCGGRPAAVPVAETEAEGAARVFAVARGFEESGKTKQAMDAYHQVVRIFPNTPEARKAAERITKAQRDAIRNAATRKRQ